MLRFRAQTLHAGPRRVLSPSGLPLCIVAGRGSCACGEWGSMAYVPNCKCDVFVSVAHLDDVAIGTNPSWVSSFARDLKKVLRIRLGVRGKRG